MTFIFTQCKQGDEVDDGVKTVYFPETKKVQQIIEYKNGKKNGCFKEFFIDGSLKAKQFYVNDSLNDSTLIYYPDGKLKTLHVYKNKIKHGCWKDFNKEGLLYSEIFFKNGYLDSTCSNYSYRTIRLLERITYSKGLKNGPEEHYYPTGKHQSIEYFDMGQVCKGTEEWTEDGKKVNNDFNISVSENDAVLMKSTLSYNIRLQDPRSTDKVYQVIRPGEGNKIGSVFPLKKKGDAFVLEFNVSKGSFIMEKVTIAAFRKTQFGNTFVKTHTFNAASNNF